ncbi:MAG: tail fiber domain-containing protein [Candidatus Omnitrophica bacterium]|nr:tail fiber domain-containing protein [Candidatus Omnitrophota bacterium]
MFRQKLSIFTRILLGCLGTALGYSFISLSPAEEIRLTTYYPAPAGDYDDLHANNLTVLHRALLATEPAAGKVGIGLQDVSQLSTRALLHIRAGDIFLDQARIGIGTDEPWNLLHIQGAPNTRPPTGEVLDGKSYVGSFTSWDSDNIFTGLWDRGIDRKDSVIVFGDNPYEDNLRIRVNDEPKKKVYDVLTITGEGNVTLGGADALTGLINPPASKSRLAVVDDFAKGAQPPVMRGLLIDMDGLAPKYDSKVKDLAGVRVELDNPNYNFQYIDYGDFGKGEATIVRGTEIHGVSSVVRNGQVLATRLGQPQPFGRVVGVHGFASFETAASTGLPVGVLGRAETVGDSKDAVGLEARSVTKGNQSVAYGVFAEVQAQGNAGAHGTFGRAVSYTSQDQPANGAIGYAALRKAGNSGVSHGVKGEGYNLSERGAAVGGLFTARVMDPLPNGKEGGDLGFGNPAFAGATAVGGYFSAQSLKPGGRAFAAYFDEGNLAVGGSLIDADPNVKLTVMENKPGKFAYLDVKALGADAGAFVNLRSNNRNWGGYGFSYPAYDKNIKWLVGAAGHDGIDARDLAFYVGTNIGQQGAGNYPRMIINRSGNVGIGTISPIYRLHVVGNVNFDGSVFVSRNLVHQSDLSLKENITPLGGVLPRIASIQPVSYNWREASGASDGETNQKDIGLIAQEVEAQFPELVSRMEVSGLKGVDYSKFSAVLLQAIKEQQAEIETLKTEIEALKSR